MYFSQNQQNGEINHQATEDNQQYPHEHYTTTVNPPLIVQQQHQSHQKLSEDANNPNKEYHEEIQMLKFKFKYNFKKFIIKTFERTKQQNKTEVCWMNKII